MIETRNEAMTIAISSATAALGYAHLGIPVLPVYSVKAGTCECDRSICASPGKHPCLADGVKGASSEVARVREIYDKYPTANVAIATGPVSNLLVLDFDGPKGLADLADLQRLLGPLPTTPRARTGGGGVHLYLKHPPNLTIGNSVKVDGRNLDIRGDGGYVVAPPSIHESGGVYSWEISPETTEPVEVPGPWVDYITGRSSSRRGLPTRFSELVGTGEGSRHTLMARVVGIELQRGADPLDVRAAALECAATFVPPLPEHETCRIVDDLAAKDACREADLVAEVANPDGWEVPIPFGEAELLTFPTGVLPDSIGDFVRATAVATQTPPDLAAMLALAVLAAACAKRYEVRINPGYAEPLNLFTAVSLGPGNRKSSVYAQFVLPLMRHEESRNRNFRQELAVAKQRLEAEEARLKDLNGRLARTREEAERAQLGRQAEEQAARVAEMRIPSPPRLVADNTTPERLAGLMAENDGRIAVMSPEGELFEQIAGRYSGRANLDVLLKGHAGDDIRVDRMGRPSELIVAPALTVGVAVQPQVIADLFEKPGFRGKGLIARILFSMPVSLVGRRDVDAPPVPDDVRERYHRTIASLLSD